MSKVLRPDKKKKDGRERVDGIATPSKLDVLGGRGGTVNRHTGNRRFRDEARKLRGVYRDSNTCNEEKFQLSQVRYMVI